MMKQILFRPQKQLFFLTNKKSHDKTKNTSNNRDANVLHWNHFPFKQ